MPSTLYIDGATSTFSSVQPDMTDKVLMALSLPDNAPLSFGVSQLQALMNQVAPYMQNPTSNPYNNVVFEVTIGS